MKPPLLVLVFLSEEHRQLVSEQFELIYAPNENLGADRSNGAAQIAARGSDIRFVLTNGTNGLLAEEIAALPKLELVCTLGVGFENVDRVAARARGIPVCNAAGTNDDAVADHAMAILLAAIRRVPFLNNGVRHGLWRDDIPRPPHVSGRKMGIFGLGAIGKKIAKRAQGFDMEIGYHSRTRRDETGFKWFDDITSLAAWCDFLVIAAPGGKETYHVVNKEVLDALGPQGVVVNIARGTLVDSQAVADALRDKRIWAAALDVYEFEPVPPACLLEFDNAVLTPHIGGISPQAIHASVVRFLENADAHRSGKLLLTLVN
ncbi:MULTISPECIES: 2-hydroxyacid dehydrogenase [unclassified Acidovorax]|uniref:2-hydroxyacid dehydrogenase n=1 Tax=unclassified Acidovorax TaxID=2684926 RepID=UPI001C45AA62|nr:MULTISPECIES: 2-hydroxyacid dehydrogenase [unclassified Acidovorax]MBV7431669.1 2-hydroxyacid dehydrogenase [Acidovorax sp. sif0732]MBV7452793.1 2-hydroxyacid dehydrogenase [Acidovorax sp. sif0715]